MKHQSKTWQLLPCLVWKLFLGVQRPAYITAIIALSHQLFLLCKFTPCFLCHQDAQTTQARLAVATPFYSRLYS